MTREDLAAQLALITEQAPKLRGAGVVSLKLGDVELVLAPADPPDVPFNTDEETDDQSQSPLDDPATFNRTNGAPSRRRRLMNGESDHGDRD